MAKFTGASSQYLVNTTVPFSAYPLTVAAWTKAADIVSHQNVWGAANGANDIAGGRDNANMFMWDGANTGTAGTIVANTWVFTVWRFITATNKRIAVYTPNTGATAHAQLTVSAAIPAGLTSFQISGSYILDQPSMWDGDIAEFWYTNSDIQPDGAQLADPLLRTLAWGGPFMFPHVANALIEYRRLWFTRGSNTDVVGETYNGTKGRQLWVNTNGVTVGPAPPLPGTYVRPGNTGPMIF